jgi:hypothetical protein
VGQQRADIDVVRTGIHRIELLGMASPGSVETFGHDDLRNVLYTCRQADQCLMIARLSLQISWPSQRVWMSR